MQHISGDIGQSVRHDYGDFITIKFLRVRKDLITSYTPHYSKDEFVGEIFRIQVCFSGAFYAVECDSRESVEEEIKKLDRIFEIGGGLNVVTSDPK